MKSKLNRYKQLRIKLLLFSIIFYISGILVFSYWNYKNDKNILLKEADNKLYSVANNIKYILPSSFFELNHDSLIINKSVDWKNIKTLTQFAHSFHVDFLYILVKKNNKVYFVSCGTNINELNRNNYVRYWTEYHEASNKLSHAFESKIPVYETSIDQWGKFRSILIPIKNSKGEIMLLGADFEFSRIKNKIYLSTFTTTLKGFFFIFLALPLFLSVYYIQRKNSKHLESMVMERTQNLSNEIIERKNIEAELKKSYTQQEELVIKANAASQAKSNFLATMSHEIRTPMNGIIGMINILKQSDLTNEQKDSLNIIDFSANNLLTIVNDILDFSKIESGKIELDNIPFDIYKSIDYIIKMLSFKTTDKNISLRRIVDSDVPRFIIGDPVRINQIILNLTNNAIKFTEKGNVSIHLEKVNTENEYITLKLNVIDTGIGISKEGIKKLFKDFSQANSNISRKYGGTGLGLAISRKLAEQMGGEIGVESKLGEGSLFWFTIKIKESTQENYLQSIYQPILKKMDKKLEILVAEDNIINQKIVTTNLKKMGHRVEVASNGQIAVELFKEKHFDIILMDVQMPETSGIDATINIREIEKNENRDPIFIVAMTANVLKEDIENYLKIGMNSYLSKPFKIEELIKILNNI